MQIYNISFRYSFRSFNVFFYLFFVSLVFFRSLSVMLGHHFWHKNDLFAFRVYAVVVAGVSAFAFNLSGELCERSSGFDKKSDRSKRDTPANSVIINDGLLDQVGAGRISLRLFWRQIRSQQNLWIFVVMNLVRKLFQLFNLLLFFFFTIFDVLILRLLFDI